jgi:hypothetical protein
LKKNIVTQLLLLFFLRTGAKPLRLGTSKNSFPRGDRSAHIWMEIREEVLTMYDCASREELDNKNSIPKKKALAAICRI